MGPAVLLVVGMGLHAASGIEHLHAQPCICNTLLSSCTLLQARLDEMAGIFEYDGQDTCAAGEQHML